ncbi:MAG: hypothetical protein JWO05_2380 [Gemmatimonadetes bacterium]|nr:hypothetical protein [Gemmatimonadota bacterium]
MSRLRLVAASALFALAIVPPVHAQARAGLMGDLIKDVTDVEQKLVGLANTVPVDRYSWRPAAGVRSVSEVYLHLASDNYLLPSMNGVQPPASVGIDTKDFATLDRFEKQSLTREQLVAAMHASFDHLRKAMADTPDAKLDDKVTFFGQTMTVRALWIATATHLHEHLGQSIAYARTNGVVPPWSK